MNRAGARLLPGVALVLGLAGPAFPLAEAALIEVPSGMPVRFHDAIAGEQGVASVYRFRFVAPEIGGAAPRPYEEVAPDMDALCQGFALSQLDGGEPPADRIVISLMAEVVAFGDPSPGTPQYFEAYSLRDGRCIWEAF